MQPNVDNIKFCIDLVEPFAIMKRLPAEHRFDGAMQALAETLLNACKSREVAAEVAKLVIENEEDFPAPATLRKYLRERNYVEEDVEARNDERSRRESAQIRGQLK